MVLMTQVRSSGYVSKTSSLAVSDSKLLTVMKPSISLMLAVNCSVLSSGMLTISIWPGLMIS